MGRAEGRAVVVASGVVGNRIGVTVLAVSNAAHRSRVWVAATVGALGCWCVLPSVSTAAWNQPVASPLNVYPTKDATGPSITSIGGTPYVAWVESNGTAYQLRVAQFTGGAWTAVGGSLNVDATKDAMTPSVTSIGGSPYVAWVESNGTADQVRVKQFTGGAWTAVGGSLNVDATKDATTPSITTIGGTPYVVWVESNGIADQIRVKQFTGGAWTPVGGSLNVDPTKTAIDPRITSIGGTPYVAWREDNGVNPQVRVARFTGGAWTAVGGSLNFDPTLKAFAPSIASIGGTPYVAWEEFDGSGVGQIRVKQFTGGAWTAVRGSLNVDPTRNALEPSITSIGGVPYVVWVEFNGTADQGRVKHFTGGGWTGVGGSLNVDPTKNAFAPGITIIGGTPYVAWQESSGTVDEIRVARLEPDISSQTADPSATGATLTATVNDFGVPLPVGFEYGLTSSFGSQTPLQTTSGAGTSTVTQSVAGLTPGTTYFYRAFGSDTFRETSRGGTQSFRTPPLTLSALGVFPRKVSLAGRKVGGRCVKPTNKNSSHKHCRRPVKLNVSYTLNAAAAVTFALKQMTSGRTVRGKCVKPTNKNRGKPKCTITKSVTGSISQSGAAGANTFAFNGRIGGHSLGPGSYLLSATPITGGQPGAPVTVEFTITS